MDFNKVDDSINMITSIQNEAAKKVKAYARPKTLFAIVELVLCVILSLGVNMVYFGFDLSKFTDPTFYVGSACTLAGVLLVFRATINAVYYKTSQRKVVLDSKEEYSKHNKRKELDLKEFLKEYNKKRKIELYIEKINSKMYKVEKKLQLTRNQKKIMKFEEELTKLRNMISVEFIQEHIDRTPIKQTLVFYSDFNELDNPISSHVVTRANYNSELNKQTFNKFGWYIVTTFLLSVGVIQGSDGNWVNFVCSVFMTLIMIVWRIVSALQKADLIYDSTITKSILDRTDILKQYEAWKITHPEELKKTLEEERAKIKAEYEAKAKLAIQTTIEQLKNKPEA